MRLDIDRGCKAAHFVPENGPEAIVADAPAQPGWSISVLAQNRQDGAEADAAGYTQDPCAPRQLAPGRGVVRAFEENGDPDRAPGGRDSGAEARRHA